MIFYNVVYVYVCKILVGREPGPGLRMFSAKFFSL